jgi:outer membrane protein assembly factor BamB
VVAVRRRFVPRHAAAVAAALLAFGAVASGARAAAPPPTPGGFIGFRGDGTGVFPDDCDPVTKWSEGRFESYREGRDTRWRLAAEERKNVVWKTPLKTYSNGGMIVVGGRLYLLKEPWTGDLGPRLYALDARTGRVLWDRDCNHLALLPEADRAEAAALLRAERAFLPACQALEARLRRAAALTNRSRDPELPAPERSEAKAEAETLLAAVRAEARRLGDVDVAERERGSKIEYRLQPGRAVQDRRKRLGALAYYWNNWVGNARRDAFVGAAFPTPVSDGTWVYVTTGHRDVFCYDLDGRLRWMQHFAGGQGPCWGTFIVSPVLVDDVIVVRSRGQKGWGNYKTWTGLDRHTGRLLWEFHSQNSAYMDGTPAVLRLPVGPGPQTMACLFTASGKLVRVADGTILARDVGWIAHCMSPVARGDTVYFSNAQAGGGYGGGTRGVESGTVMAVRFVAQSRDDVRPETLWTHKVRTEGSPLVHGGLVFWTDLVVEADTGRIVREVKDRGWARKTHVTAKAGPYVFLLEADGRCVVATADRTFAKVAENRLDPRDSQGRGFWNQGAQPFFSGNRIFLRSYRNVYCLGDPEEPTRLSKAHGG